jgi:hypothetical protein
MLMLAPSRLQDSLLLWLFALALFIEILLLIGFCLIVLGIVLLRRKGRG